MNPNSKVIIMLCSHLLSGTDCKPFTPSEWSKLADTLLQAQLEPKVLPDLSDSEFLDLKIGKDEMQRIRQLLRRGANLTFELEKYNSMGIYVVTRADAAYPKMLKHRLGKRCPPLFYYAGNLSLAGTKTIGFVGSRRADENDLHFTEKIVYTVNKLGFSAVSGGAKGIDTIAGEASLKNGCVYVAYLADSMVKRIRNSNTIKAIQDGRVLLMSAVSPDTGFTAATAMMRNRYIYAQSAATVVVHSDYKKGGTWAGAADCLKHDICPEFCWDNKSYRGNQELIKLGAIPINEDWNGDVSKILKKQEEAVQLSLFD